jgi:hypothetical protein
MFRRFRRESFIRWLMREYGLTRSEAEAYIRQHEQEQNSEQPNRVVVLSSKEDDPPLIPDWVWWAITALGFGYVGLTFLEWLTRKRKRRRETPEEWLV